MCCERPEEQNCKQWQRPDWHCILWNCKYNSKGKKSERGTGSVHIWLFRVDTNPLSPWFVFCKLTYIFIPLFWSDLIESIIFITFLGKKPKFKRLQASLYISGNLTYIMYCKLKYYSIIYIYIYIITVSCFQSGRFWSLVFFTRVINNNSTTVYLW